MLRLPKIPELTGTKIRPPSADELRKAMDVLGTEVAKPVTGVTGENAKHVLASSTIQSMLVLEVLSIIGYQLGAIQLDALVATSIAILTGIIQRVRTRGPVRLRRQIKS